MDFTILKEQFENKKVFVTGHTGFKGSWLLLILKKLGAQVVGYSLAPENKEDLFNQIDGAQYCEKSIIANILDAEQLKKEINAFQPDYIFHLAAQALVRKSYDNPIETYMVNTIGTANVLEAMRTLSNACVGIMVTTDKVYENPERGTAFVESDKLGGYDPYSASKATCEIVIDSYRNSFFNLQDFNVHKKSIASVRAGNVIGGGDFSKDRIIPDIVRSIQNNTAISLRNPNATRPWQHVLEPLGAYLLLAAHMRQHPEAYNEAFNFGPAVDDVLTVKEVTEIFLTAFGTQHHEIAIDLSKQVHEAKLLMLNSEKAKLKISWTPKWKALDAIQQTAWWYVNDKKVAHLRCAEQISNYFNL